MELKIRSRDCIKKFIENIIAKGIDNQVTV